MFIYEGSKQYNLEENTFWETFKMENFDAFKNTDLFSSSFSFLLQIFCSHFSHFPVCNLFSDYTFLGVHTLDYIYSVCEGLHKLLSK